MSRAIRIVIIVVVALWLLGSLVLLLSTVGGSGGR